VLSIAGRHIVGDGEHERFVWPYIDGEDDDGDDPELPV
jgi:hypothetical protein